MTLLFLHAFMYEIDTSAFKLICFFYMCIFIYNFIIICSDVIYKFPIIIESNNVEEVRESTLSFFIVIGDKENDRCSQ